MKEAEQYFSVVFFFFFSFSFYLIFLLLFSLSFIIFILWLLFAGYGLRCDQCASTKSWEDCATNNNVVTCPSSAGRCGTAHAEGASDVKVAVYAKGCSTSSVCNSDYCKRFVSDPSTKITKCEMDCCSGDLCNIAKLPAPRHSLKCYQCSST